MKSNTLLLAVVTVLLFCTMYVSYKNFEQIQVLREENYNVSLKIDSLLQICHTQPQAAETAEPTAVQSVGSAIVDYFTGIGEAINKSAKRQKIEVTSKYSLEDRYVSSKVAKPEITGEETGLVVLNILVNWSGDVKSAKLKSATGITNEEVIEACKKAALRTRFNSNSDQSIDAKQPGTITYIFSAK